MATTQQLHINGTIYTTDADSEASLLFVLRDHLNLLGSKYGRAEGQCGACTVWSDGKDRRSCITRRGDVARKQITTIEGLAKGAGEGSLVGVAPAIANAIFDATGVQLRSLPLVPNGLKVS